MAGHSKWANIKHRKNRADITKGKIFSRLTKEIFTAVKQGGPDPKSNSRLRLILQKARLANMPNENVERNIKKAASTPQSDFFSFTYELYGYGGVGILAEVSTDNKNRISSEMRIAVNKKGGTLASPGAVLFNFEQKGVLQFPKKNIEEEALFKAALEAGAEDFETVDDCYMVITSPDLLFQIKELLDASGFLPISAELEMIPKNSVECSEDERKANLELLDWIESIDDVDVVYHNMAS